MLSLSAAAMGADALIILKKAPLVKRETAFEQFLPRPKGGVKAPFCAQQNALLRYAAYAAEQNRA